MIPEITSLTFLYAFKIPGIAPQNAPASIAITRHTDQWKLKLSAKNSETAAPATYCPAAPMLKKPTLYANKIESEHITSGAVLTRVEPKYFITACFLPP